MSATPILVSARRDNPLCGDTIELSVGIVEGVVHPAGHQARACSLVVTSAALLSNVVAGKTVVDARAFADRIERAVSGLEALPGGCDSIAPVLLLPARRRCALLPWQALRDTLAGQ
ncbi:MAG TPA: iron-sulfur cluster assembly scaffold protein [Candidatus Limnocylindria bacterium]|nr:iron-sulfur cluster assembly scaffold protein [Candidatus Limnocylindria bacterium]